MSVRAINNDNTVDYSDYDNAFYDPDCNCASCRLVRVQASHKQEVDRLTREKLELAGNAKYWQERAMNTNGSERQAERAKMESEYKEISADYLDTLEMYADALKKLDELYTTIRVLSGLIQQ